MPRTLMDTVAVNKNAHPSIRRAMRKMGRIDSQKPGPSPRAFMMQRRSPEGFYEDVGRRMVNRGRELEEPRARISNTGLLFRCEPLAKFLVKVMQSSCDLSRLTRGEIPFPGELKYASHYTHTCSTHWTSTTVSIVTAIHSYGAGWIKHAESHSTLVPMADLLGITFPPMLVLMAINPKDMPVSLGLDAGEVAVEGKIPLSDMLILNRRPGLFESLAMAEDPGYKSMMYYYLKLLSELESPSMERILTGR